MNLDKCQVCDLFPYLCYFCHRCSCNSQSSLYIIIASSRVRYERSLVNKSVCWFEAIIKVLLVYLNLLILFPLTTMPPFHSSKISYIMIYVEEGWIDNLTLPDTTLHYTFFRRFLCFYKVPLFHSYKHPMNCIDGLMFPSHLLLEKDVSRLLYRSPDKAHKNCLVLNSLSIRLCGTNVACFSNIRGLFG